MRKAEREEVEPTVEVQVEEVEGGRVVIMKGEKVEWWEGGGEKGEQGKGGEEVEEEYDITGG